MSYSARPLSSRRRVVQKTISFEREINDFLRTPIKFEAPSTPPRPKTSRSKSSMNTHEISGTTSRENKSDQIIAAQRRAFELAHKRRANALLKQTEKNWKEDQRYYEIKTKNQHKKLQKQVIYNDQGIIEDIIEKRNDYYLATVKEGALNSSRNQSSIRVFPRTMRAYAQASNPMFE